MSSLSDQKRGTGTIRYQDDLDGIEPDALVGFFVDWPNPPSAETHRRMLAGSSQVVLAVETETGDVVGFVTALTDGVLSAYIPLLEVKPAFQGRGIGSELMRRLLQRLSALYMVDLVCDADLTPFYERLGMRRATGMMMRNYDRQDGAPPDAP